MCSAAPDRRLGAVQDLSSKLRFCEVIMRYVCPATVALAALTMFAPSSIFGQGALPELSIGNYNLVNETRSTRTDYFVTYSASLLNNGAARSGVTATVTSLMTNVQVIPGQGT